MATDSQIAANILNSQKSTGPSPAGKEASSRNATKHGLSSYCNATFFIMPEEDRDAYELLKTKMYEEHDPQSETENILVRRMYQSEWLRARAIRLQQSCIPPEHHHHMEATQHFALYLRYQITQERAFYKALNELQKLRNERRKSQIGFVSHKLKQEAAARAQEAMQIRREEFELKKIRLEASLLARQAAEERKNSVAVPKAGAQNGLGSVKIAA